jgi:transmembrane sensor
MSEANADREAARAAEKAAEWFVRLQGDDATGDDWLAFEAWLRTAPANAAAYEQLEQVWVDLDEVAERTEAAPATMAADRRPLRRPAPRPVNRRAWLAAGGALAASVALGVFVADRPRSPVYETYRTAAGETRTVTLADGTRIRLNAASTIRVALEKDVRRVEMADAEAAFDVAHDADRPFLIAVGDRQVRVVGTEFNLRRREGATVLTVRQGVVEVRPLDDPTGTVTRLAVGQQLVHHDGAASSTVTAVEPIMAFAWTNGQLIYQDTPLSTVAADLSRRFGIPIGVADPETGRVKFTGVLVTDNVSSVLRRIEAYAPVTYVPRGGGGFILRRRHTRP